MRKYDIRYENHEGEYHWITGIPASSRREADLEGKRRLERLLGPDHYPQGFRAVRIERARS